MLRRVDLHTHSTASDGTDTPAELVRNAHKAGLAAVALTDHDTLSGLAEAQEEAKKLGDIEFVRGVEVSTGSDRGEMHILGLWVPDDAQPLEEVLDEMRLRRNDRNGRIIDTLRRIGCNITMDDVKAESGGDSVGRPHIARALVKLGYARNFKDAFDKFLAPGGKAYIPKDVLNPNDAVSLMSHLGCSVIVAHPMLKQAPPGWIDDFIRRLVPYGLCGIEAWHSEHTEADARACIAIARRNRICVSGGSDYHGRNKPRISLGSGYGSLLVTWDAYQMLRRWRLERGLPC